MSANQNIKRLALARQQAPHLPNQKAGLSLVDLENLFIDKLLEKYQLTERDLQRAFKRFDKDNSGYLDTQELAKAIQLFVNGVDFTLVQALVKRYDVDNDGTISLDEFVKFLLSRSSPDKRDWLTVDHLIANEPPSGIEKDYFNKESNRFSDRDVADTSAETTPGNPNTLSARTKSYLQNIKALLIKKANEMRFESKIPLEQRLTNHLAPLAESTARSLISKSFQPYLRPADGYGLSVDFPSFNRVMMKFLYPGAAPPKEDVIQYLFDYCKLECKKSTTRDAHVNHRNESINNPRCDPDKVIDLIFSKTGTTINKFGFIQPVISALDSGRPEIANGPFAKDSDGFGAKLSDIPQRFMTKKSWTGITVPSDFDISQLEQSGKVPRYHANREFVNGVNFRMHSGNPLFHLSEYVVIYSCASLGVVHDNRTNSQRFFEAHDDDITCITAYVSSHDTMVATGQLGRRPVVYIWDPRFPPGPNASKAGTKAIASMANVDPASFLDGYRMKIGQGFFQRAVCSVEFSFDGRFICAIGCDDKHDLGVWFVNTGQLITSMTTANGVPPQINCLVWSQSLIDTSFVSKEHSNADCDLFCTVGERYIKFWSFRRPDKAGKGSGGVLATRGISMGKMKKVEAPRGQSCCVFISGSTVVTGGDTGSIYLFAEATCIAAHVQAIPGGVWCMVYSPESGHLVCGGAHGIVIVMNATNNNLEIMQSLSVLPSNITGDNMSAHSVGRAISTPRGGGVAAASNTSRAGSANTSTIITPRPRSGSTPRETGTGAALRPSSAGARPGDIAMAGNTSSGINDDGRDKGRKKVAEAKQVWKGVVYDDEKTKRPPGTSPSTRLFGISLQTTKDGTIKEILCVTGFGRLVAIDLTGQSPNIYTRQFYHYGPTYALASDNNLSSHSGSGGLIATGGDDCWVMLWSYSLGSKEMVARIKLPTPIRCLDFDNMRGDRLAAGLVNGGVVLLSIEAKKATAASTYSAAGAGNKAFDRSATRDAALDYSISQVSKKADSKEDIADIKFSPNSKMIAAGSHDNFIYIYAVGTKAEEGLKPLKKLRGHSSYITHIDWSADNRLLRSTCGAYELLYWNVPTGKQFLSSHDSLESDTVWATESCVLGFPVMGIWPPASDGTDVNAVDVSNHLRLVAVGDDFGKLRIFNYPCIAKNPGALVLSGHSSHVMNVKFAAPRSGHIITVGGNDCSWMLWSLSK